MIKIQKLEIDENGFLKKIPACANINCNNPAIVMLHGVFVCGECFIKFKKHQEEKLLKEFKEIEEKNKYKNNNNKKSEVKK